LDKFKLPTAGVEQWLLTELERKNGVISFCGFQVNPQTTSIFSWGIKNDDFFLSFCLLIILCLPLSPLGIGVMRFFD
jgi:hypothetical protein